MAEGSSGQRKVEVLENVEYCPVCGVPPEYCGSFPQTFDKCKPWLREHHPELYPEEVLGSLSLDEGAPAASSATAAPAAAEGEEGSAADEGAPSSSSSSSAAAGGSGNRSQRRKKGAGGTGVVEIAVEKRRGRKMWTFITGLHSFDVNMKQAAKELQKRLAAGVSATEDASGVPLIECHGDARMTLVELMVREWNIPVERIVVKEGKKKEPGSNYLF